MIHPEWLKGQSGKDEGGQLYGGSAGDEVEATIKWSIQRASSSSLIEVRGKLPEIIVCPLTGAEIETGTKSGNVPKRSNFHAQHVAQSKMSLSRLSQQAKPDQSQYMQHRAIVLIVTMKDKPMGGDSSHLI